MLWQKHEYNRGFHLSFRPKLSLIFGPILLDYKLQILIFVHIMSLETYPIQGPAT